MSRQHSAFLRLTWLFAVVAAATACMFRVVEARCMDGRCWAEETVFHVGEQ